MTWGYSNSSIQVSAPATSSLSATGAVSISVNGSTISIGAPAQSNQTEGLYALGNTTGQSSSSTFDARTMSFSGAGGISLGFSNSALVISGPAAGAGAVNFSAGTTSNNLATIVFSNSNGVSFGLSGSTITASAAGGGGGASSAGLYALGNTTQNSSTTLALSALSFNALGAMTMGYSNSSIQVSAPPVSVLSGISGIGLTTNGSTVSIGGAAYAFFEPKPFSNSSGLAHVQGSWYIQPFSLPLNFNSGRINQYVSGPATGSMLQATNGTSFVSGTTGSRSVSFSYAKTFVLYSRGSGTNTSRIESFWSNTFSLGIAQSVSVSSGGATNLSVTNAVTLSYIASIGSDGNYTTSSLTGSTQATVANSSMNTTAVSGATSAFSNILSGSFILPVGITAALTPGNYWLGQAQSINSTTAGTTVNASSVWSAISQYGMSGSSAFTNFRIFNATAPASTSQFNPGVGVFSAVSASPPSTIAFSDIRTMASAFEQYFNMLNSPVP